MWFRQKSEGLLSDCRPDWVRYVETFFNKVQLKRRHINCYEHSRYTSNEKTNKQKCSCSLSEFIRVKQGYVTVLTRCIWCMCSLFALKGVYTFRSPTFFFFFLIALLQIGQVLHSDSVLNMIFSHSYTLNFFLTHAAKKKANHKHNNGIFAVRTLI